MKSTVRRARSYFLFGLTMMLVGLVPVLYCLGLVAWQAVTLVEAREWVALPAKLMLVDHALVKGAHVAAVLPFIPEFPVAWIMDPQEWLPAHSALMKVLEGLHVGVPFALPGAWVMLHGSFIALPQRAVFAAAKREKQSRLRRIHQYRRQPVERDEPPSAAANVMRPAATRAGRRSRALNGGR